MTTNSVPERNKNGRKKPFERNDLANWNSTKLLESLFNLEQVSPENNQLLNQSLILTTAATEALRLINCDRVIFYHFLGSSPGKVIAEAVNPQWNSVLGKVIDDPYLAPKYLASYQQGYYQAIDNIYKSDLNQEPTNSLQKLQIQAILIVPIVQANQLWGLLVAHQCSATRQWQRAEINCLEQISTIVKLALDHVRLIQEKAEWQQQAESEAQWTQFFSEALPYIYQSQQSQDVLKATVKEVRRILNCDRVVVYSLNTESYAEIIAESIAPGWTKALGKIIKDPCFEARYIEKYQYGRVRAINNIYTAKLTECYIEQLELLEVKANLVAPIIKSNKVFGLLVAHQCSEPRQWKQYEIRWSSQVALQVGLALSQNQLMASSSKSESAKHKSKWKQLLQELIIYLGQSKEQSDLLDKTTKEARRILDCDRVVVYNLTSKNYAEIIAESVAPGWTKINGQVIQDFCQESQYQKQYEQGLVRSSNNINEAELSSWQLNQLTKLGVKANLVAPILVEGQIFGLLIGHYCREYHTWELAEIDFLKQLAIQVGLELERTQLIAERDLLKERSQTEKEWTEFFTQAVQYIHQSLTEKDILDTSVEEVRRVLDCDRVVIYGLNEKSYGEVIAESVALGWTKVNGIVIDDPCFEVKYLEQYQNGRVRAIDNIHEAKLTDCYRQQLEELEVKANLVTPILNEGKIFGLLVAHQCSHPREWKQYEIRWSTQISTQIGFALDNAQLLRQLEQSSQVADYLFNQHNQQKAAFKQQLIATLSNSINSYENLTESALSQSESLLEVLHQIEKISDIVKNQAIDLEQVQIQKQQDSLKLQAIQKSIDLTSDGIVSLQYSVQEANSKMNYLSHSSQTMLQTVHLVQNLVKKIVQQSLNITITIGRTESAEQESIIKLTDKLLSTVQELYKASAQVNPLLSLIDTEVVQSKLAMESAIDMAIDNTKIIQNSQRKLNQIISNNADSNFILEQFVHASQKQTKIAASTVKPVSQIVNLAHLISQYTKAITESFNQLLRLTQQL